MRYFLENQRNQGTFKFKNIDVLNTQPYIQLSVKVPKFFPLLYHSALYSHFEAQLHFVMKPKV